MLTDYAALTDAQVRGYLERLGIHPAEGKLPEPDLQLLNRLPDPARKSGDSSCSAQRQYHSPER